jgi:replicative DNA helicase
MSDPSKQKSINQPYSHDAEAGLVCSCILSQQAWLAYGLSLKPEIFYVPAHRIIWLALRAVSEAGQPFEFHLVKGKLQQQGLLEEIGGTQYLNDVYTFVPTGSNARYYLEQVLECYQRREGLAVCRELETLLTDSTIELAPSVADVVERALSKLSNNIAKARATFPEMLDQTLKHLSARAEAKQRSDVRFGIATLDWELGGIEPGETVVICGETSSGKSALAMQAVLGTAMTSQPAAIFSLEMPFTQLIERMLALDGAIPMRSLRSGKLKEEEYSRLRCSVERLKPLPIFIEEAASISEIVSRCRALKIKTGLRLVLIDYLQLVSPDRTRRESTWFRRTGRGGNPPGNKRSLRFRGL